MWVFGWYNGFFFSIKGLLAGCGLLIIPFALGGMGGGDVKLLAALGSWLGYIIVVKVFLFGSIAGAFIALYLIFLKNYKLNMMNIFNDILFFALTKKRVVNSKNQGSFPYSIPMFTGFLIYILFYIFDFSILGFNY